LFQAGKKGEHEGRRMKRRRKKGKGGEKERGTTLFILSYPHRMEERGW